MNRRTTRPLPAPAAAGKSKAETSALSAEWLWWRETIESISVAVILAFLFRAFVAEAFVIPTGSMAPTLMGRHMEIRCPECGFQYQTGASTENALNGARLPFFGRLDSGSDGHAEEVQATTCPNCRYCLMLDKSSDPNQRSFNGDRILVNKFAYQVADPRRWDVIVFKYPGNAKVNYIKRLVGLPGETLLIRHGDIFVANPALRDEDGRPRFEIVRKSPDKLRAMLHTVYDSQHVPAAFAEHKLSPRWEPVVADSAAADAAWKFLDQDQAFTVVAGQQLSWLRYRHRVPSFDEWEAVLAGKQSEIAPSLITDYYAYNDNRTRFSAAHSPVGSAWVGDLGLECRCEVQSDTGELAFDLVEGGLHFQCRIDVATGQATLSAPSDNVRFLDGGAGDADQRTAHTALRGRGTYSVQFVNADDQLYLWINDRYVTFDRPTTFTSRDNVVPVSTTDDLADLAPIGVGARGASVRVQRLRVLRDTYYLAAHVPNSAIEYADYPHRAWMLDDETKALQFFRSPARWDAADSPFHTRIGEVFTLAADQFFPLGDNSPQSKDARLWGDYRTPDYVRRDLLIGRAIAIYWPHGWRVPAFVPDRLNAPLIPNFHRMKLIR